MAKKKKYTISIDDCDYELTEDSSCETCAFFEKAFDFCNGPEIKCLPNETGGFSGNYKKVN